MALLQAAWAEHAGDHVAADAALSRAASSGVAGEEVDATWPSLMRAQLASTRGDVAQVELANPHLYVPRRTCLVLGGG